MKIERKASELFNEILKNISSENIKKIEITYKSKKELLDVVVYVKSKVLSIDKEFFNKTKPKTEITLSYWNVLNDVYDLKSEFPTLKFIYYEQIIYIKELKE